MKRVLMISEKFPPFNLSGSARPFYFAKYLPEFGYQPTVIAATVPDGEPRDDSLLAELSPDTRVYRTPRVVAPAAVVYGYLRAQKQRLSLAAAGGRVTSAAAGGGVPASANTAGSSELLRNLRWWAHWEVDWGGLATAAGLYGGRKHSPDLVWVSGPHFRNFVVGYRVASLLGRPLVVDLRDPWTYGSLWAPKTPWIANAERAWARKVLGAASRVVFTSPLTMTATAERFPDLASRRLLTITNGFDPQLLKPRREVEEGRCLLRYIGMLNERRRPDVLIEAFHRACRDPEFRASATLQFIGNACGHESKAQLAPGCDVRFAPPVSRAESLQYMAGSDVNILLQTISEGQDVVSGKAFDYLSAKRPILAVVDEAGGDAWLVRRTGAGAIVPWTDVVAIAEAMTKAWTRWKAKDLQVSAADIDQYSRQTLTGRLAAVFDEVLQEGLRPEESR